MIQRIQSVYLFLASLAIYLLFLFPIANLSTATGAKKKKIMITGVYETINGQVAQTESFTLLMIATVMIGIVPIVLIFLYKNRKRQLTLVYTAVIVFIAYSFWISQTVKSASGTILQISDYGIGAGLTSVAVLFLILAGRGIQRDEKLVKSADRLR
ncbi:MAG: DUF4293 domain-containing protein [Sphingobacteriales bacterium]|nr:DUF4293 domain-containing protein [Sphingobacteriales bacterium]